MNVLVFLDDLRLDRSARVSLGEQLRQELRAAILEGRIHTGSRMPSSRFLAEHLSVARNIVISVYEDLITERYLETRPGIGTFVSEPTKPRVSDNQKTGAFTGVKRAKDLLPFSSGWLPSNAARVLEPGIPGLDCFPSKRWGRCFTNAFKRLGEEALNYDDPQGAPDLRAMIAGHIGPSRGVACSADQIIVLSSMRQALHVLFHFFLDEAAPVLIENPCLQEIHAIAKTQKVRAVPMPVGANGADIAQLSKEDAQAQLAVVSASHQYPLGVEMSAAKRAALLEWSNQADGYIVEDDYDGEFWMTSAAPQSLYAQAKNNRIIYLNSFSKTVFPALRISYMVVPKHMVEPMSQLKALYDPHPSSMAQLALAEFIGCGAYSVHLREMRTVYRQRHNFLRHALEKDMGDRIQIAPNQYGLHLCADLAPDFHDKDVAARMKEAGFGVKALSSYYFAPQPSPANGIVMGYAGWPAAELKRASKALRSFCD